MNKNTKTVEDLKSVYKLNPSSNRFRVCPNCSKQHMVNHLGKDFCCDHCADEFYNANRRLKKQAEQMLAAAKISGSPPNIIMQTEPIPLSPPQANESNDNQLQSDFETNIKFLDSLRLDPDYGSFFHLDYLADNKFNHLAYSGKGKLYNIDPVLGCHFMQYGRYRIYRFEYSQVLIYKTK